MGNRIIKESICVSEQIDELSWEEEVFWYRLLVNCDDYGCMDARPKILKAKLFPLKDIRPDAVGKIAVRLAKIGLIQIYEVNGQPYLQVIKWAEHQRVRNSIHKYPAPDAATCGDPPQPAATCGEPREEAADCGPTRARAESRIQNPESESRIQNPNPKRARGTADDPDAFDKFWSEYPKKVKKPDALKAWTKIKPDAELQQKIHEGLERWKISDQWKRDSGRFIPYPATWLNARQWEDTPTISKQYENERDYSGEQEAALKRMMNDTWGLEDAE